jgi:hypothetical protein
VNGKRGEEWLLWCLGTDLFANVVAHFGINYMAQMMMSFFPLLACISAASFEAKQAVARAELPVKEEDAVTVETASGWAYE